MSLALNGGFVMVYQFYGKYGELARIKLWTKDRRKRINSYGKTGASSSDK